MNMQWLEGYRKVWIMLLLLVTSVILRAMNLLTGAELVDLLKTCSVSFFGANLTEHIIDGVKSFIDSKKEQ